MSARGVRRVAVVAGVLGLAIAACVEDATSPAQCPDFCPGGQIATVESLLATAIGRDSTFRGYVERDQAFMMLAATLPQIDSRPIFETLPIATRFRINTTGDDTTTAPIVVDSAKLTLTLLRRDTAAHNLRLAFYRLPLGIDSTSTFAGLAPDFAAAPMRVVNLDSLLAQPGLVDSVTGDRVVRVDSVRHAVTVSLKFDTTQLSFVEPDSGKVAFGVRVTADSLASVALGASEEGSGPRIVWFNRVDSAGTLVPRDSQPRGLLFDGFVFDPPAPALDSNLIVGGVPSARTLLRFTVPRGIRDSSQIIRATLLLVPVAPAPGVPVDSFFLSLSRLAGDFGFKSPLVVDSFTANTPLLSPGGGSTDTVRIEVTRLLRAWQLDTTAATAAYLRLLTLDRGDTARLSGWEGTTFTALRLYSSRTPAFRPGLHVTFIPRFKFGVP